jgi:hypothetical protein
MRLWSIHPKYLDTKGLTALWREALLAQAVISGLTKGYKNHPQLYRFRNCSSPPGSLAFYLQQVQIEASSRGYKFDGQKIKGSVCIDPINVTKGQLEYEWNHLKKKILLRAPHLINKLNSVIFPEPHPLFKIIPGDIEVWEKTGPAIEK